MAHIGELTTYSIADSIINEMIEDLPYLPRKRGRPKQYFTDEEKVNRQREYSKRYYYKNQEHVLNRIRAYKDANQDMIKEKAREYYQRKKQCN